MRLSVKLYARYPSCNIVFPSTLSFTEWSIPLRSSDKCYYSSHFSYMYYELILYNRIISGQVQKLTSISNILHPLLLFPYFRVPFISPLCSQIPSMSSSFRGRHQVSHLYNHGINFMVLYLR